MKQQPHELLKQLRVTAHLSKRQVAIHIGDHYTAYRLREAGTRPIYPEQARRLGDLFDVDPERLTTHYRARRKASDWLDHQEHMGKGARIKHQNLMLLDKHCTEVGITGQMCKKGFLITIRRLLQNVSAQACNLKSHRDEASRILRAMEQNEPDTRAKRDRNERKDKFKLAMRNDYQKRLMRTRREQARIEAIIAKDEDPDHIEYEL